MRAAGAHQLELAARRTGACHAARDRAPRTPAADGARCAPGCAAFTGRPCADPSRHGRPWCRTRACDSRAARAGSRQVREQEGVVGASRASTGGPRAIRSRARGCARARTGCTPPAPAPAPAPPRLRLTETVREVKVAVLAVRVLDVAVAVADRCGGQDRDRIASHLPHQQAPAAGELIACHPRGGLVQLRRGRRGRRARHGELLAQQLHAHAHELHQLRVGILVVLVRRDVSTSARLISMKSRTSLDLLALTRILDAAGTEAVNPWHHCASAWVRSDSGAASSGSGGSNCMSGWIGPGGGVVQLMQRVGGRGGPAVSAPSTAPPRRTRPPRTARRRACRAPRRRRRASARARAVAGCGCSRAAACAGFIIIDPRKSAAL